MQRKSSLISVLLLAIPMVANAEVNSIKPGLWEVTTTSELLGLASQIPPSKMKDLDNLAKEYGFEMPAIQNGAAKSNACITQEMANQKVLPDSFQTQVGCVVKNVTHNGNSYRADYVCENPQLKGNGSAQGTLTTPESFTGSTTFSGVVQGAPVSDQADVIGKWISTDCASAKR